MKKHNFWEYVIYGITLLAVLALSVAIALGKRKNTEDVPDNYTFTDADSFTESDKQADFIKYLEEQLKKDICCSFDKVESAEVHIVYLQEDDKYEVSAEIALQEPATLEEAERQQIIQMFLNAVQNLTEEDILLNIVEYKTVKQQKSVDNYA
ncbi:MAG: hypothetical protein ACI4EQ_00295 [Lachnospiraceae bacterium]